MKKTTSLHCTEGGSDKVYHLSLEPSGAGFVVNFAYGRRGSTLQTGTKTNSPVSRTEAEKIFGKIVSEKTGKGYVITEMDASDPAGLTVIAGPGNNAVVTSAAPLRLKATPFTVTRQSANANALRRENVGAGNACLPQLLNEIDARAADRLIADDNYCLQQKHDGNRMMLVRDGAEVYAANKQGLKKAVPAAVATAARTITIADHFILDGELVGDILHVFDILELRWRNDGGSPFPVIDVRDNSYAERHESLVALLEWADPAIATVTTAFTTKGKQIALEKARAQNWEGVVFKRTSARYTPGRPEHGGDQFKYKFWKSCSAIVSRVNAKRSVAVHLFDDAGQPVNAGNVTIPPNQAIPGAGTVIEIKYLYAHKSSGILYQPIYKGPRDDVDAAECTTQQLQYKGEPC